MIIGKIWLISDVFNSFNQKSCNRSKLNPLNLPFPQTRIRRLMMLYSLLQNFSMRKILSEHLPSLVVAFVIAEFFYKFKSFSLEALAFLATWFVIDYVFQLILRKKNNAKR